MDVVQLDNLTKQFHKLKILYFASVFRPSSTHLPTVLITLWFCGTESSLVSSLSLQGAAPVYGQGEGAGGTRPKRKAVGVRACPGLGPPDPGAVHFPPHPGV